MVGWGNNQYTILQPEYCQSFCLSCDFKLSVLNHSDNVALGTEQGASCESLSEIVFIGEVVKRNVLLAILIPHSPRSKN